MRENLENLENLEVKVRCGNSLHRVRLIAGAIVCSDHPGVSVDTLCRAESATAAIGERSVSRCGEVALAWRTGAVEKLPKILAEARKSAAKRGDLRRITASREAPTPLRPRSEERVRLAAEWALEHCSYRRSTSKWAGGEHSCDASIGSPDCSGSSEKVWSDNKKWSGSDSHVRVSVPLRWYAQIYRRGLAVVDGLFVLRLEDLPDGVLEVWVAKQGRGFDLVAETAYLVPVPDEGEYRLAWKRPRPQRKPKRSKQIAEAISGGQS